MLGKMGDVRQLGLSLIIQHPMCSYWSVPQPCSFICVMLYFRTETIVSRDQILLNTEP